MLSVSVVPRFGRWALPLLVFPLLAAGDPTPADLDQAWNALVNLRPKIALHILGDESGLTSRPARLAWATAMMAEQPSTDANMQAAEQVFVELAAGRDDIAAQAAYLRARLYQVEYAKPDYAKAADLYRELAARQPQSHWAQLGLVKLAMLELYVLPEAASAAADPLALAETLLAQIREPLLRRDLDLLIGQAGVSLHQPLPRLIPHLIAAESIGGISGTAQQDLVIQIGELSLRAGLNAQAKDYFERYLREFPLSLRADNVRIRLQEANRRLEPERHA